MAFYNLKRNNNLSRQPALYKLKQIIKLYLLNNNKKAKNNKFKLQFNNNNTLGNNYYKINKSSNSKCQLNKHNKMNNLLE